MLPATVPLPGRIESRAAWPSTDPSAGAWCDGVRGRVTGSLTLDPSAWLISIEAKRQKAVDAPGERSGGSHDARVGLPPLHPASVPAGRECRATMARPTPFGRPPEEPQSVPVLATFFSVRRGRDPFFKFFMRKLFPRQVKRYEEEFGVRFIGWYNVAYGWDFDNVILLELPDYATIDKLEADERSRALGHRAGEWIFERHHSMFLRERMGPDLEYHP